MKDEEVLKYLCDRAESSYEFVSDLLGSVENGRLRSELLREKETYGGIANYSKAGLRARGVAYGNKRKNAAFPNEKLYPNSANMALWKCENDLEELERTMSDYKKSDYDRNVAAFANDVRDIEKDNIERLRSLL